MTRLYYHPTYMKSVRNSKLPHFNSLDHPLNLPRHPMDYKYRCGFDPEHKTLEQCVNHWEACQSAECQQKAANWADLKDELLVAYGRK